MINSTMNRLASRSAAYTVLTGFVIVQAICSPCRSETIIITYEPEDRMIGIGSSATFSVKAEDGCAIQWLRNGIVMNGQTNSRLTIENVGIGDAGYYSCIVSKDTNTVPSRSALLTVFLTPLDHGGGMTVYGTPVVSGGSSGTCLRAYAGYVNYTKPVSQGWGWDPSTNATVFTASDGTARTDTKVEYLGKKGDEGCNQASVTLPNPSVSKTYRFSIYFPTNVPTTNYPIVLSGFNP